MPRGSGPILLSTRVLEAMYVYVSNKSDFTILQQPFIFSRISSTHHHTLPFLFSQHLLLLLPIRPLFQLRHEIYILYSIFNSKANMHFLILSVVAVLAALANVSNASVIGGRQALPTATAGCNIPGK